MLFFRSEDHARAWCEERKAQLRPLVSMDRLWKMATTWYASRLDADARRPQPEEIRAVFAAIGLHGDFWDPKSDRFAASA